MVVRTLKESGFRVKDYARGREFLDAIASNPPAVVLLDLRLPDIDGLTLLSTIRERHSVGVIIVSGLGELSDRVLGLNLGADDYLPKPFEPRELVARVSSLLRRADRPPVEAQALTARVTFAGWQIDRVTRVLLDPAGQPLELSSAEFRLLDVMVAHANEVMSRDALMRLCYPTAKPAFGRAIDIGVARLRRKLGARADVSKLIRTVRNQGYVLSERVLAGESDS